MTEENRKLTLLLRKRDQIIKHLERIDSFVTSHSIGDIMLIKARHQTALESFKNFSNLQEQIEEVLPVADLVTQDKERIQFEELYYSVIANIETLIEQCEKSKFSANIEHPQHESKFKIKLPTIELPEFNGNYADWLAFRDIFKSLVHENESLSDIEKMHYLCATLKGEALRAIESLTISSANYNAAWELITNRFENTRHLVQAHISNILNSPTCKKFPNATPCNHSTIKPNLELENLNKQVIKFWETEDCNTITKIPSQQDLACEAHFKEHTKRDADGRFWVSLAIKDNCMNLGTSYESARKRFIPLERRLQKNSQLKSQYVNFMREYQELGHMELVPENQSDWSNTYYIPHHAVFKNNKIRVVFDASMKSDNNLSLNQNLLTGPTIQDDIFAITLRFRTYQFVISADITKMYRQININIPDREYQRIFWRESPDTPVQIYRLTTVTYGTTSAPFLAIRSRQQLAIENRETFPTASAKIIRDFYVDDLLSGADILSQAFELQHQIDKILKSGGFQLCKWASVDVNLIPQTNSTDTDKINLDKHNENKTLGLYWNYRNDSLAYKINSLSNLPKANVTKKHILSTVSKIFDPLGLISPVVVKAKLLLQKCWSEQLLWDQKVPHDINSAWLNLIQDLTDLDKITIARKIVPQNVVNIQIHGFADASEKAYGAVIYLRTTDSSGNIQVNLLTAKSRIAPMKTITIPRLELMAAVLLSELLKRVILSLDIKIDQTILWTDSTIVLHWLARPASHWQIFVGNRVAQIQSESNYDEWRHVVSTDNPADVVSRGMSPEELSKCSLWWHGPKWLVEQPQNWPSPFETNFASTEIPEIRKTVVTTITKTSLDLIEKFSSYEKLLKCVAYLFSFINYIKSKRNHKRVKLDVHNFEDARNKVIKFIQRQVFAKELNELKTNGVVNTTSAILSLSPFIDNDGIIRVGGRLRHSNFTFAVKHPILLPSNHHFTKLVIQYFHEQQLHAGAQATLAAIRQQYWILSARNVIRHTLHKCIRCFRTKPKIAFQKMGDLPEQRLNPTRPFSKTGVDYCGPITIKEGHGRGKRSVKAYIALFICLCTKAVHLELVSSLTSSAFLNALKRVISRRGNVLELHSDNAKNFVGGNNELQELNELIHSDEFKNRVIKSLQHQVKWNFIPPRSPNFGGIWESNVKSVKIHLKKVIGSALLTFEEMYTFLTRVEACLNSRPFTPLSNDPNDLSALTPGHFLIGESLTAPPEKNLEDVKLNRLDRWQLLEKMRQEFWIRFQREYITQLQRRNKWKTSPATSLKPGCLVLLVDEQTPPLTWPLGRVQEVHPGRDGLVRVATVKTNKGVYKRAISKLSILPIDSDIEDTTSSD
ncbi:uncharacterized protein LOC135128820 [Zophobas morio]|uniref:uncharacterized protein LOC135128820 n=1 Tax=Zophobas morio TaxID=2755281 RepID=UPI00308285DA